MKKDARQNTKEQLKILRERGIELRAQGWKVKDIAEALGVCMGTVFKWLRNKKNKGATEAIKGGQRGRKHGACRILTQEQEQELFKLICDKTPQQLKFEFAMWTRKAVQWLIAKRFNVHMGLTTVGELLHKMGMTAQRPMMKAIEQDPVKIRVWLDETYPQIQAEAKKEGAVIYWSDETAVKPDSNWIKGFAPKGQTPILERSDARWCSCTMVSAISNQGKLHFRIQDKAMNSELFIEYLGMLIHDEPKKVFLIVDNLQVYKSSQVKAWLSEHEDRIKVFFLPPYSPELNPDEYVNRAVKTKIRMTPAKPKKKGGLKEVVCAFMKKMSRSKRRIKKIFDIEYVRYAKA